MTGEVERRLRLSKVSMRVNGDAHRHQPKWKMSLGPLWSSFAFAV